MSLIAGRPEELRQAATHVDGAAAVVGDLLRTQGDQLAVGPQPGWDSIRRLSTGAPVWTDYLGSFVGALGTTAEELRVLADMLANADDEAERRVGGGRILR